MDWGYIITTLSGLVLGTGGLATFLYFKENKSKAESEALKEDASAGLEMLNLMRETTAFFNTTIEGLRLSNSQKDTAISDLTIRLDSLEKSNKQLTYSTTSQQRQIKGLTAVVKKLVGSKDYAERHLCLVKDCTLRKPELGTYRTETPEIETTE
ncbi:hypothetical protein [Bacteroides sedimenti]|uniref:DNA recombination protein RmuC n=1 Tax=Bacteroides sedimenti TaxID=2136147 RepID=A0ABN6Z0G9_9BACE